MTVHEYLGLDSYDRDKFGRFWLHDEKYSAIVNAIGYERVRRLIPFSDLELADALEKDKHLNCSLPKPFSWDEASGFRTEIYRGKCFFVVGSPLARMCRAVGITSYSNAQGVCILKQCAKMAAGVEEKLDPIDDDTLNKFLGLTEVRS